MGKKKIEIKVMKRGFQNSSLRFFNKKQDWELRMSTDKKRGCKSKRGWGTRQYIAGYTTIIDRKTYICKGTFLTIINIGDGDFTLGDEYVVIDIVWEQTIICWGDWNKVIQNRLLFKFFLRGWFYVCLVCIECDFSSCHQ